jgi:inosose dehydratase
VLGEALAENGLTLIGGVVFRPFHDPAKWDEVMDAAIRTCKALVAHGARHLVLIDSSRPAARRPPGRAAEAEQMDAAEWAAFRDRIATSRGWGPRSTA